MTWDCNANCPGCACHINPPCSHCTDHFVDEDVDQSGDIKIFAHNHVRGTTQIYKKWICKFCGIDMEALQ